MSKTPYVRTFDRFELKYGVPVSLQPDLVGALRAFMTPDQNGDRDSGYAIRSVYCDAPDLQFFWEKVDGVKFRRKLRFRRYAGQTDAFLEIKQRVNRAVQKRRTRWDLSRVHAVFRSSGAATEEELRDPVAAEFALLWRSLDLRPTLATHYRRFALQGTFDPGLRITFDTEVQCDLDQLDIAQDWRQGTPVVDGHIAIMEIKFHEQAPAWLSDLTSRFGLKAMRMSKYCRGIDLLRFGGRLT